MPPATADEVIEYRGAPRPEHQETEVEERAVEGDTRLEQAASVAHYALEEAFLNDRGPDSDSRSKESALHDSFSRLDSGQLKQVACKASVCRGELLLSDGEADQQVFHEVVLSGAMARTVPGAFTVASREEMPDGSIRAVFFVHPDELLQGLGEN